MSNLTKLLRAERERCGLTLRALAQAAQISPAFLCEIEKGTRKPSPDVLRRLCSSLGTDYRKAVKQRIKDLETLMLKRFGIED